MKTVQLSGKALKNIQDVKPQGWRCPKCHRKAEFLSEEWRWNGHAWEHDHGYLIGHIEAERIK